MVGHMHSCPAGKVLCVFHLTEEEARPLAAGPSSHSLQVTELGSEPGQLSPRAHVPAIS